MPYCTLDDLKLALPVVVLKQLTDDDSLGDIAEGEVSDAISKADAEIDAYLGGRYGVPLSSVPAVVKRCSCDIAIYHLYSRKVEEIPETRETRYRDAIKLLDKISQGKIALPGQSPEGGAAFSMGVAVTSHFDEAAELGGLETVE